MGAMSAPVLIGHRGSSGYRPEHTLASYELAARTGADYLEADLVSTRDGVLVCRHENELSDTTDIARRPEFADYRTTKVIDGRQVAGWFTEDLTLDQIRTLRAVERLPQLRPGNTAFDGQDQVPTFADLLELRARLEAELARPLGVYPETKHPSYFAGLGLALEEPLLAQLQAHSLGAPATGDHSLPRVVIQSFELGNLQRMRGELGCGWPLIYLIADSAPADATAARIATSLTGLLTAGSLRALADHVDGIGPHHSMVIAGAPVEPAALGAPTPLVAAAHSAGLVVHPWTFRAENQFLPAALRSSADPREHGDLRTMIAAHLEAGIDGFFTDHVELGRAVLDGFDAFAD